MKADGRMDRRPDLALLSLGPLIRQREMRKEGCFCTLDWKMQLEKQNNVTVMHQGTKNGSDAAGENGPEMQEAFPCLPSQL